MPGRRLKAALAAYLPLLAASHAVRIAIPPCVPTEGKLFVDLDGVRVAYRDSAPGSTLPVVLLVHGSPGSNDVFRALTPALSRDFRVIAPDLPGFGGSTRDIPDYSFGAHAGYLLKFLDCLNVESAQMVGYSMGGGVVLSLFDMAPGRVSSIVLLSSIGVQERELLGSYRANHVLHGLQLGALWAVRYGAPHFGWMDRVDLNVEYARNFFDSDQRPLRAILQRYRGRMLIVHGRRDRLVPLSAALEHHRLVRQSELVILEEDHFVTFRKPWTFSGRLLRFLTAPG